ncbi:MAG: dUTP diphosphatase [Alphaproteobacteria bacterium]|nr:dUTP diphosphatase [Alphaproteobacteria bacterium]
MSDKHPDIVLKISRLSHGRGLELPRYQSDEAAGLDLVAAVAKAKPVQLRPGERALIPTGLCFELPKGFEAQVRPRSGLALKHGVTVLNTPGTIDSDYRGEVQIILINHGDAPFTVHRGDRIAQLIIAPVTQVKIKTKQTLATSGRGGAGFGSTGQTNTSKTSRSAKKKTSAKCSGRVTKKTDAGVPKSAKKSSKKRPRAKR